MEISKQETGITWNDRISTAIVAKDSKIKASRITQIESNLLFLMKIVHRECQKNLLARLPFKFRNHLYPRFKHKDI